MKAVSQTYKDNIKQIGRELTYEITYTLNGTTTTLGDEDILNANLHYEGGILKSVMKQLDIELYNDLPIGTELTYKFGVKTGDNTYEKINYGHFIVYSSEKQENSNTYKLVCYDKMLNAMKDYEAIYSKNLFDVSTITNYGITPNTGATWSNAVWRLSDYIKVEPNTTYTFSWNSDSAYFQVQGCYYNENKTYLSGYSLTGNNKYSEHFTTPNNCYFIRIAYSIQVSGNDVIRKDIQLESGSTSTNYVPYLSYPITLRDYTTILSDNIGLRFANATDDFSNYDKTLDTDLYVDNEGKSLGYTYRDVLDEIAEATASTICINDNDELEIRYLNSGNGEPINYEILGDTTQNTTPSKNILPNDLETRTENGVTITKNEDGTYTLNGTATADISLAINNDFIAMSGTWRMFGCPSGGSSSTYMLSAYVGYWGSSSPNIDTGSGTNITYTGNVKVRFYIKSGTQCDNLIFKPMLTTDTTTNTFEPYTGAVPNPNFPREVINKTGAVEMTFASGKNLFDGITENGGISATNGTNETIAANRVRSKNYILVNSGQYTLSCKETNKSAYVYCYDNNKAFLGYIGSSWNVLPYTFTLLTNTRYIRFVIKNTNDTAIDYIDVNEIQVEEGNQASTYEKYYSTDYTIDLGDLELCKIGTYQDRLFKASGKNLFDGLLESGSFNNSGLNSPADNRIRSVDYINVEPNTQYTLSFVNNTAKTIKTSISYYSTNDYITARIGVVSWVANNPITFTTPNNCNYIRFVFAYNDDTTITSTNIVYNVQIEKGNTATTYEPYGNYWYKYNAIGKVVLNGSEENWSYPSTNRFNLDGTITYLKNYNTKYYASNCYIAYNQTGDNASFNTLVSNVNYGFNFSSTGSTNYTIRFKDTRFTSTSDFKTWLSTNNVLIYYQLETPTYERITGDLERQLNNVKTLELIDAEYLKDINVNFGEMVKPINTLTLKRSGDSDAISLSIPEDLSDDLKNEISISENQIMNFDDRDTYMKSILGRLYGMSYAINDFNSTGITWLELCDRYNVKIQKEDTEGNIIESNVYPCIMFNDEINVNQGLNETIHTDRPEESITDYNTTTKTDRLKTRTDLIVNKQEGSIELITADLRINEDGESEVINGIIQYQDKNSAIIRAISSSDTTIDENGNIVPTGVKTSTGFTFDKDGLKIQRSGSAYNSLHNERGEYYFDGTTPLGETTPDGSKFKNMDIYGEFRYGKDEIGETALFVSMLYNDGNEECFGHFYNGREVE